MPRALVSPLPAPDPGLSCHPAMLSSRGPRVAQAGGTSESQCPGHPDACDGTFLEGGEQPFLVKSWAWQTHCFPLEEPGVQDTTGTRQHPSHHPTHWPVCPVATMQVCPPRFCAVAPHKPLDSVNSRLPMGPTRWPLVRGQAPQGCTVIPTRVVTAGAARPKRPHPAGFVSAASTALLPGLPGPLPSPKQ